MNLYLFNPNLPDPMNFVPFGTMRYSPFAIRPCLNVLLDVNTPAFMLIFQERFTFTRYDNDIC